MVVETERLRLRQWRQSDFEKYAKFYADQDQSRYVGGPMPRATAWRQLATIVGHWQLRGYGLWAVEEKKTSKLLGSAGLWQPEGWPELELGYWLMKDAQRNGFAVEAATYARDYAFNVLQSVSLVSYIDPNNIASIAVAKRAGASYQETIELLDQGKHEVYRYARPGGNELGVVTSYLQN